MKKIIFLTLTFSIVFVIYYFNIDKNVYYLSIGDHISYGINNFKKVNNSYSNNLKNYYSKRLSNYVNYSSLNDYRIMDLYNDIINNRTIIFNNKKYKMQNLLIKANIITVSVGINDLIYKNNTINNISYEYADELLSDVDKLFNLVRRYNKDRIYMLGYYNIINNNNIINYINTKLQRLCKEHKIIFVNIKYLNNYILNGIYPTNDGYTYITKQIIDFT